MAYLSLTTFVKNDKIVTGKILSTKSHGIIFCEETRAHQQSYLSLYYITITQAYFHFPLEVGVF